MDRRRRGRRLRPLALAAIAAVGLGLAVLVLWPDASPEPAPERPSPQVRAEPELPPLPEGISEDERRLRLHLRRGVAWVYDELQDCGIGQASLKASVPSLERLERDLAKIGMRLDEGKVDTRRALMEVQAAHTNSRRFIEQELERDVPAACDAAFEHPALMQEEVVENIDWGKRPEFLGEPAKAAPPADLEPE